MRGLYAIVDTKSLAARGIEPLLFAEAVLSAQPTALQLRGKDLPPREALALLRALVPLCRRGGALLVANDRPDLAALAGCDLVHVGQEDMPVEQVRRIAPHLGIGISTHNPEQLERALALRPSYVAYGPVFPTTTKREPDPVVGLAGLAVAASMVSGTGVPLVGIGGITVDRVRDVARLADAAAVISGLYPEDPTDLATVAARALLLQQAFVPPQRRPEADGAAKVRA